MTSDSIFSRGYYGVVKSGQANGASIADALLIREDSLALGSDLTRMDSASFSSAGTGIKFNHVFKAKLAYPLTVQFRVRIRIRWSVVASTAAALTTGRWTAVLRKNGTQLGTAFDAPARAIDVVGVNFIEQQMVIDMPKTSFVAGDTFEADLGFSVVTAGVGNVTIGLYSDPTVSGNEVIVEQDVGTF